jgi:eukaryotic-like serine/threonine-protein kinase
MNPLKIFQSAGRSMATQHPKAHMTWASRSVSQSITRTSLFLRRQIWIWPLIAIFVLGSVGYLTKSLVESTIRGNLSAGLQSFVTIQTAMLEKWFAVQQANAEQLASSQPIRRAVYPLLASHVEEELVARVDSVPHIELQKHLGPAMSSHHYVGYFVADSSKRIVASSHRSLLDQPAPPEYGDFLDRCLNGKTAVALPFASVTMLPDATGRLRMGQPVMYVCAPIRDEETFQIVGALALQIRPEHEFTGILQLGQIGATGETYGFNQDGVMISNSRFDDHLILLGLLPDMADSKSMLNISLRDPGGNMEKGFRPTERRAKLPLTKMAASAIAGNSGIDVDGYSDYRGVPVVGAWRWLPEFKMGVATEIDVSQAYRPLVILRRTYFSLFGMLTLSSIAIFIFTIALSRAQREAQKAVVEARHLGQYRLEEKLGEGAMGIVYRGHHAMMRRPAAIKMLNIDKINDESLDRFEREVQITCQLNHPNTIAIYDYGRTPEGVFYYAMEYIEGIDLQTLVTKYGPQPESRVIYILRQMCGSLFEAHSQGLVHRDIKPANTMISRRGCEPDVVKVLDFGLVKAIDDTKQKSDQSLAGTPLYMSPEAIQSPMSVDACSDLYAVGAVGYYLLTGSPVFEADSIAQLCRKHVDEDPVPPSERTKEPISSQLEHVILSCLEKKRSLRPQTARDLSQLLSKCPGAHDWTVDSGDAWWGRHARGLRRHPGNDSTPRTDTLSHLEQTMDQG